MDWFAAPHALLSHLPVATGLLLPWALLAAQRPGRGIRAWWTVSRYLGWLGLGGLLVSLLSGFLSLPGLGLVPVHRISFRLLGGASPETLLLRHVLLGSCSLLLGGAALWAMTRPRKEHQSLGLLALGLGLLWSVLLVLTGDNGHGLGHLQKRAAIPPVPAVVPALAAPPVRVPPAPRDPEAQAPLRALDYAALQPVHPDPVKSLAHGGRWIRAWVSPEAAEAYRAGDTLPVGTLVVLSSQEDRWGRPGPEVGPLYALEIQAGGPSLTFYWPRVPAERRREVAGATRVYWRGGDAQLEACRTCHVAGLADPAKRSRWRPARRND